MVRAQLMSRGAGGEDEAGAAQALSWLQQVSWGVIANLHHERS
jgi:hypothetical protein